MRVYELTPDRMGRGRYLPPFEDRRGGGRGRSRRQDGTFMEYEGWEEPRMERERYYGEPEMHYRPRRYSGYVMPEDEDYYEGDFRVVRGRDY